jgi:hypothetical protein
MMYVRLKAVVSGKPVNGGRHDVRRHLGDRTA